MIEWLHLLLLYIQDPFIPVFYSNAMSISNVLFHIGDLEIFSLVPSKLY